MEDENLITVIPKWLKITAKVVKWLLIISAVAVIGWLTLCSIWQKGPKAVRRYSMTENAAKEENKVYTLNEYNGNELDRLFFISNIYYTKGAEQLQFTLRYNVYADGYSGEPINFEPEKLSFMLTAKGTDRSYSSYYVKTTDTVMYKHYKLVFEEIDFEGVDEYDVCVIYNGRTIGSCIAWMNDNYRIDYKLGNAEKKVDTDLLFTGDDVK